MNFDDWCYSKQINGNWKEALFHGLAAKFGADTIPQDETVWAEEWRVIIDRVLKAMAN